MPELSHKNSLLKNNWPGISWALLIFILSSISAPQIYIPDFFDLFSPDKVVHFFFYGILVYLLVRGFKKAPLGRLTRNQYSFAVFSSATYGGLIELYQGYFLPDRTGDWVDFLANCIGCVIGWIAARIFLK
ncbi:hypothetical protein BH11BAC2_BH11BAC2_02020 [soil metagenome]